MGNQFEVEVFLVLERRLWRLGEGNRAGIKVERRKGVRNIRMGEQKGSRAL